MTNSDLNNRIKIWFEMCAQDGLKIPEDNKNALYFLIDNPDVSLNSRPISYNYISTVLAKYSVINPKSVASRIVKSTIYHSGSDSKIIFLKDVNELYFDAKTALDTYGYYSDSLNKMDIPVRNFGLKTVKGLEVLLKHENVI